MASALLSHRSPDQSSNKTRSQDEGGSWKCFRDTCSFYNNPSANFCRMCWLERYWACPVPGCPFGRKGNLVFGNRTQCPRKGCLGVKPTVEGFDAFLQHPGQLLSRDEISPNGSHAMSDVSDLSFNVDEVQAGCDLEMAFARLFGIYRVDKIWRNVLFQKQGRIFHVTESLAPFFHLFRTARNFQKAKRRDIGTTKDFYTVAAAELPDINQMEKNLQDYFKELIKWSEKPAVDVPYFADNITEIDFIVSVPHQFVPPKVSFRLRTVQSNDEFQDVELGELLERNRGNNVLIEVTRLRGSLIEGKKSKSSCRMSQIASQFCFSSAVLLYDGDEWEPAKLNHNASLEIPVELFWYQRYDLFFGVTDAVSAEKDARLAEKDVMLDAIQAELAEARDKLARLEAGTASKTSYYQSH